MNEYKKLLKLFRMISVPTRCRLQFLSTRTYGQYSGADQWPVRHWVLLLLSSLNLSQVNKYSWIKLPPPADLYAFRYIYIRFPGSGWLDNLEAVSRLFCDCWLWWIGGESVRIFYRYSLVECLPDCTDVVLLPYNTFRWHLSVREAARNGYCTLSQLLHLLQISCANVDWFTAVFQLLVG